MLTQLHNVSPNHLNVYRHLGLKRQKLFYSHGTAEPEPTQRVTTKLQDVLLQFVHCLGLRDKRKFILICCFMICVCHVLNVLPRDAAMLARSWES